VKPSSFREADIRPADVHAEYLRLSVDDALRLFPNHAGFTHRECPGCAADRPQRAFTKNDFTLDRCGECGTLYVNPCPTPEQLTALYVDSISARFWSQKFFPAVAEARRHRIFRPRAERVLALMDSVDPTFTKITEVGAGSSIFLQEVRSQRPALSLCAVEPGKDLANQCRENGFQVFEGFADAAASDERWCAKSDVVVSFEVIEHSADTFDFIKSTAALARAGGLVILSGLSSDGFDITVLNEHANAIAPPHHLTFLSVRGAESLMMRAGLERVKVITPGELDVDIVVNALKRNDGLVADPFLRRLLQDGDEVTRASFQEFLRENRLSSHMWVSGIKRGAQS
jgi:hypothetical protein